MNVHLRELAARQADLVAAWQLLEAGWSRRRVVHHVEHERWRAVHSGVYALGYAPLTRRQLWIAATLTTPESVLSHASAAACYGIREFQGNFEVVTRPGSGGPKRVGGLLVCRSRTLAGDTTVHDGIRITTAARVLIDLAPHLRLRAIKRMFREALRLKVTTREAVGATLGRHLGRRGTPCLADLCERYADIDYQRTRSDAEGRALEVLHDAGLEPPLVNHRISGEEADLVWPARRRIIEIDGPQYHRFPEEDARKQGIWERAGYVVDRISSDRVYDDPAELIALAAA